MLFAVLPIIFVAGLWIGTSFGRPLNYLVLAFISCVFVFIAQFGRHGGKTKQEELWDSWGGPPTTRFLRHSNPEFNRFRRSRCHKNLQMMFPDQALPTAEEEKNNPELADQVYEAYTRYLIGRTKDRVQYPLIHAENINYGFLRNLWGLKPYGLFLSISGLCGWAFHSLYQWCKHGSISYCSLTAIAFHLVLLFLWIFWINPGKVKVAAEAYAERLLEYCEQWQE